MGDYLVLNGLLVEVIDKRSIIVNNLNCEAQNLHSSKKPILHYRKNKRRRVTFVNAVNLRSKIFCKQTMKMMCNEDIIKIFFWFIECECANKSYPTFNLSLDCADGFWLCVRFSCIYTTSVSSSLCLAHLIDLSEKYIYIYYFSACRLFSVCRSNYQTISAKLTWYEFLLMALWRLWQFK